MNLTIPFDNTYVSLPENFYAKLSATKVSDPKVIAFNRQLSDLLGITQAEDEEIAEVFSGNVACDGSQPLAQLYAGHQFGQYNPQLGDGRALLLGETVGTDGVRRDIQLKGSGPTPFSRGADGRAWLGPVLREFVISEAMHSLNIPTTRALAAVLTGEKVVRDKVYPGAVLTRVAKSHLRVGTFQVFSERRDFKSLRKLLDYAIERHYPNANGPLGFLKCVIKEQATLIPKWMGIGFIHGVMNTDNCQIAGETIDYGPCAFIDEYHPMQVFSSIDQFGRYSFAKQPDIIVWNMAQLATALLPLESDADQAIKDFTIVVNNMQTQIRENWLKIFAAKIGISDPKPKDEWLIKELLTLMEKEKSDFTNTFFSLITGETQNLFSKPEDFKAWERKWKVRISKERKVPETLRKANPVLIPRNHRIEEMINAALKGDFSLFNRLLVAYRQPFEENPRFVDLKSAPNASEIVHSTFCGT